MNNTYRVHYSRVGNPSYSLAATENWDSFKLIKAPTAQHALANFVENYTNIYLDGKKIAFRVPHIDKITEEK